MSKLMGLVTEALPEHAAPEGQGATLPRPSGKYMRGGRGVTFAGWRPALREAQDEIGDAWDDAAARVNDLLHNSGWLAGVDADGSVLFDYFTEFGESQQAVVDFDLDNASAAEGALRKKCAGVIRQMAGILDGLPYTGIMALCGDAFFDDLIAHPEVRETYKGYADAASLRNAYINSGNSGIYGAFEFGGITWMNYRGGQNVGIDTDKCHLVPSGVPGLFRTVYAPADYIETVNTPGQRLYGKQWEMQNGKGVNLEFQMNALHYCTRPRVLIPGKRT
jgi:hypothetical protein